MYIFISMQIWVYFKRHNPHNSGGGRITGENRVHVLDDFSRGSSNCPQKQMSRVLKCKQIKLIIVEYASADILYTEVIVHFMWNDVTTASPYK